jgi:deazaflavin-dependent oxidoreductase (nitroreductase family)
LSLTTISARSGQPRCTTLAYFPGGDDAWLIAASAGGTATHPVWLFNLARHPAQAWIELGHRKLEANQ